MSDLDKNSLLLNIYMPHVEKWKLQIFGSEIPQVIL